MESEKPRKLTPHDLAFGIGRKATSEELKELLSRPVGEFIDSETARKMSKEKLKAKRNAGYLPY